MHIYQDDHRPAECARLHSKGGLLCSACAQSHIPMPLYISLESLVHDTLLYEQASPVCALQQRVQAKQLLQLELGPPSLLVLCHSGRCTQWPTSCDGADKCLLGQENKSVVLTLNFGVCSAYMKVAKGILEGRRGAKKCERLPSPHQLNTCIQLSIITQYRLQLLCCLQEEPRVGECQSICFLLSPCIWVI